MSEEGRRGVLEGRGGLRGEGAQGREGRKKAHAVGIIQREGTTREPGSSKGSKVKARHRRREESAMTLQPHCFHCGLTLRGLPLGNVHTNGGSAFSFLEPDHAP